MIPTVESDAERLGVVRQLQKQRPEDATRLWLLYEVSRSFSELTELEQLIPVIVLKTKELLQCEGSAILLLDQSTNELFFPYSADIAPEVEERFSGIRFPADKGIAGWVVQHGVAQLVPDVSKDPRWYGNVDRESGMVTASLLCAPLRSRRGTLGVIELRNKLQGQFSVDDLNFVNALAGSIAVAVENARLYQTVKDSEARLQQEVVVLHREMANRSRFTDIIGNSAALRAVFHLLDVAIASPVTVLLQGETGTGKELIARAIHFNGPRRERPFVAINCGALPETLLESELFGHKRGAFSGAVSEKKGLFEVADGGTIFLDEIADTSPAMQVKLLRVLQNGEILAVGDTSSRCVDVRVISASNRLLEQETKAGRFREDLYYRLSTFPINVPPLRARVEDIPALASHILQQTNARFGKTVQGFSAAALRCLAEYAWPGNVRELENEIERAVALTDNGQPIQIEHLSDRLTMKKSVRVPVGAEPTALKHARRLFEEEYIAEILRQSGGNASKAARVLGISRVMLQKKIKEYGLRAKAANANRNSKVAQG